jgi:hypothetical protein
MKLETEADSSILWAFRKSRPGWWRQRVIRPRSGVPECELSVDLAGLPLLMSASCPHCEQVRTRGSDHIAANVAKLPERARKRD